MILDHHPRKVKGLLHQPFPNGGGYGNKLGRPRKGGEDARLLRLYTQALAEKRAKRLAR